MTLKVFLSRPCIFQDFFSFGYLKSFPDFYSLLQQLQLSQTPVLVQSAPEPVVPAIVPATVAPTAETLLALPALQRPLSCTDQNILETQIAPIDAEIRVLLQERQKLVSLLSSQQGGEI